MNVLLVAPEYPPYGSGIANVAYALRSHMLKKGANVDVLSRKGADINITNSFDTLPGLAGIVPFWQQAADYVAKIANNYEIIWLHSPLLINAKKLRYAKKFMVSFHTTYYGFYRAFKAHGISHLLPYYYLATKLEHNFLSELSYNNNNTIVTAVSPSVAEELSRNGLALSPHVVPNGLEVSRHMLLDKYHARALLQQEYALQLSENDQVLLYIGRLTEAKQPLLLVKLFEAISSIKANAHLIIIGAGSLFRELREKANQQSNSHVLVHIPHKSLPPFLSAADAFISLSCYEGLPLTVLEAASFNLPLILSNIPAHRWIMNSGMGYGMLLDSHNPSFTKIVNFLESGIGEKIVHDKSCKRQYTWERITDQYLRLLNSKP